MAQAKIEFTSDSAQMIADQQKQIQKLEELHEKLRQAGIIGTRAGNEITRGMESAMRSGVALATSFVGITGAVDLVRRAFQTMQEDQRKSLDLAIKNQEAFSDLFALGQNARRAPEIRQELGRQAVQAGVTDMGEVAKARAQFEQMRGGVSPEYATAAWEAVLGARRLGGNMTENVAGFMRMAPMAEREKLSAEAIHNIVGLTAQRSRVSETEAFTYMPGLAGAVTESGGTISQAGALMSMATSGPVKRMREAATEVEQFVLKTSAISDKVKRVGRVEPEIQALRQIGITPQMQFPEIYRRMGEAYAGGKVDKEMLAKVYGENFGPMIPYLLRQQGRFEGLSREIGQGATDTLGLDERQFRARMANDTQFRADFLRRQAIAGQNLARETEGDKTLTAAAGKEVIEAVLKQRGVSALRRGIAEDVVYSWYRLTGRTPAEATAFSLKNVYPISRSFAPDRTTEDIEAATGGAPAPSGPQKPTEVIIKGDTTKNPYVPAPMNGAY